MTSGGDSPPLHGRLRMGKRAEMMKHGKNSCWEEKQELVNTDSLKLSLECLTLSHPPLLPHRQSGLIYGHDIIQSGEQWI